MNLQENIQRIKQMMISEEMVQSDAWKSLKKTLDVLKNKKKVLLLSCSNRHNWDKNDIDIPKSKMIAMYLNEELGDKSVLIDVPELKIFPCEGNVSRKDGDSCGVLKSKLKNKDKNPSGHHRCWASINNKSDELACSSITSTGIVMYVVFSLVRFVFSTRSRASLPSSSSNFPSMNAKSLS